MESEIWGYAVSILSLFAILSFVVFLMKRALSLDQKVKDLEYDKEKKEMREKSKDLPLDDVIERIDKHLRKWSRTE